MGCSKDKVDPHREFLSQFVGEYDFVCHNDNWYSFGPDLDTTYDSHGAIYFPNDLGMSNLNERIEISFLTISFVDTTYFLKTAIPIVDYSGDLTWPEHDYFGVDYGNSFSGFISTDSVVFEFYNFNSQGGPSSTNSLRVKGIKRK